LMQISARVKSLVII